MTISIRPATQADASDMAVLVDIAGHGLAAYFWEKGRGPDSPDSVLEIGRLRALRDEGSFSWRNAFMAELDGRVAGMLTGYMQPDDFDTSEFAELGPLIRPLAELEAMAPSTWYVNVLGTHAEFRGQGVGTALLRKADQIASEAGAKGLSVIVENSNAGARALYEREGYAVTGERDFVAFNERGKSTKWQLLTKAL
ncbi:N-acetyltransferase family protein [Tepidamorphus sp. 3E244]|uniref:GNAT family N-acetyltransferase n=1 Tax=Tepidamorphus sp. 3E244 TaxID=3385498 RepID=UPI0038FBF471